MGSFVATVQIAAPVERVFAAAVDIPNAPQRVPSIRRVEMLTSGPVRVGTRWRETRVMFKREATEELQVTGMEPNRSFGVGCTSCGCQYESTFRFVGEGRGTRVELEVRYRALTLAAKLMAPLAWLMAGAMRKMIQQDLDELKASIEGSGAALATGQAGAS